MKDDSQKGGHPVEQITGLPFLEEPEVPVELDEPGNLFASFFINIFIVFYHLATWSRPTKRKVGRAGEKTGEAILVRIAPGGKVERTSFLVLALLPDQQAQRMSIF